jgi:hypothetical protein
MLVDCPERAAACLSKRLELRLGGGEAMATHYLADGGEIGWAAGGRSLPRSTGASEIRRSSAQIAPADRHSAVADCIAFLTWSSVRCR